MAMSKVIVVDWGTSHLRAYLCQSLANGELALLDKRLALGIAKCDGRFEEEIFSCIEPWLVSFGNIRVVLAGQVGSSIGWKETHYLPCPVAPVEVSKACLSFKKRGVDFSIVPGVSCNLDDDIHDVMRGEELQVLGWLSVKPEHQKGEYLICLPGTHTKWVLVVDGEIILFKTAMTGELFDLLNNQSVLIQEPSTAFDEESFIKGVKYTLKSELGSFSHGVFSVRSKQLFGQLTQQQASSYLSGLLIGSDVRAAINASQWNVSNVSIIGAPHLSDCFSKALALQGVGSEKYDVEQLTLLGFSMINKFSYLSQTEDL